LLGSSATARRAREPRTASPVAFIIAAIVAPTAKSRRGRILMVEVGVAFQCAGEMSSTHHKLIF
jgi:hypothetical protein